MFIKFKTMKFKKYLLSINFYNLKINFILIFFLTNFSFFSKESELEFKIFYNQNKEKVAEGYLLNGKPEGYWINYNEKGVKISEGHRKNHLLDGIWKFYDAQGNLIESISYLENKKNGPYLSINFEKKQKIEAFYENNILNGEEKIYLLEKNQEILIKKNHYESNQLHGFCFEYDTEKPRIIKVFYYEKGKLLQTEKINQYNKNLEMTGIWKDFEGEKVKKECEYQNGLLNGFCKEYDNYGKITRLHQYKDGIFIEDEQKIVQKNRLETKKEANEHQVFFNKKEKKIVQWDSLGEKVKKVEVYNLEKNYFAAEGKLDKLGNHSGIWKHYYPNKKLQATGIYKAGVKVGEWSYFYPSGELEQRGEYRLGNPEGAWESYYENGKIAKKENYENGKLSGKFIEFDQFGKIINKGTYIDDEKNGLWEEFRLGYLCKGKYKEDQKSGEWICFYDEKNKYSQGNFYNGIPQGKHSFFYPSGLLMRVENWFQGKLHGDVLEFNELEQLVYEIKYKKNEPLISVF